MNKPIVSFLLFVFAAAAPAQEGQSVDFTKMQQILLAASNDLKGKHYNVLLAAQDNREPLLLRHWMVTIQEYPPDYKAGDSTGIVFSGPPCAMANAVEFCSVRQIAGEPIFYGRFDFEDAKGHLSRFVGNIASTASKMSAFDKQLVAHQEWTQADIAAALSDAGAKFGPNKAREFKATLGPVLRTLEKAFGPMRVNKVLSEKPTFLTRPSKDAALIGWPTYWSVSTILLRNPRERLVMYFDPFEGQMQALIVSQGRTVLDPKTHKPKWQPPND